MPPIRTFGEDAASDHTSEAADLLRTSPRKSLTVSKETSGNQSPSHDSDSAASIRSSLTASSTRRVKRRSTSSAVEYFTIPLKSRSGLKRLGTRSPASHPLLRTITIKGVQLQPTVAFDTFWRFAAERKAIDDRRRSGMPAP